MKLKGTGSCVGLVTGVVVLLMTVSTNAAVIQFQNPPGSEHFDWEESGGEPVWLDVMLPASEQGVSSPSALGQAAQAIGGACLMPAGGFVAVEGMLDMLAVGYPIGTTIDDTLFWFPFGTVLGLGVGGPPSAIPEGEECYVGFQFDLGPGPQYAWVGVVRTGGFVDAFAWAYEDQPGVPIIAGVPEPGCFALFAIGAGALVSRRRRKRF
jgi:hypothetical protein